MLPTSTSFDGAHCGRADGVAICQYRCLLAAAQDCFSRPIGQACVPVLFTVCKGSLFGVDGLPIAGDGHLQVVDVHAVDVAAVAGPGDPIPVRNLSVVVFPDQAVHELTVSAERRGPAVGGGSGANPAEAAFHWGYTAAEPVRHGLWRRTRDPQPAELSPDGRLRHHEIKRQLRDGLALLKLLTPAATKLARTRDRDSPDDAASPRML